MKNLTHAPASGPNYMTSEILEVGGRKPISQSNTHTGLRRVLRP